MKTMGVIGGVGPQATMDFEEQVHAISQRLIPPMANRGYPPMIVYYHRFAPMLTDEQHRPLYPMQLEPHLASVLPRLGEMVDFIVATSNAPHLMQASIEEAAGRKMLSMIALVLEEVRARGWKRVGALGLGQPRVYQEPLEAAGIVCEMLSGESGGLRDRLDGAILALMSGQAGPRETALATEAVDTLRRRNVDAIILGCTEIPLLLGDAAEGPDLINPLGLLAEAAVRFAME